MRIDDESQDIGRGGVGGCCMGLADVVWFVLWDSLGVVGLFQIVTLPYLDLVFSPLRLARDYTVLDF